jgi:large subunit ribosomal protein L24
MKIRKNDKVKIISGKDKGKTGKVLKVLPSQGKLVVEGLNLLTKHVRPKKEGEKGQKVKFNVPMDASKVMLLCPKCGQPTRLGFRILADKKKSRICKKCKAEI